MKKTILAGILLAGLSGTAAAAPIVNGSFETGDFSGWNVTTTTGTANVVTSSAGFTATDGSYFADLSADSLVAQNQSWGAGDTLTFDWNFNANDYTPYNDFSVLSITDSLGNILDNITLSDVATVGNYNATGWNTFTYAFAAAGAGTIGFGVYNVGDQALDSQLYLDNVSLVAVTEPATIALFGLGLVGLGFARRRQA